MHSTQRPLLWSHSLPNGVQSLSELQGRRELVPPFPPVAELPELPPLDPEDDGRPKLASLLEPHATMTSADKVTANPRNVMGAHSRLGLPFRVPRNIRSVRVPNGTATVRTFVNGIELDLRSGRQPGVRP